MMRVGLAFRAPCHLHVIQIWEGLVGRRVIGGNNGHKGRDFRHAAYNWEHEHVLEEVQRRLDNNPMAMRQRRETVEHPFGTMNARMGATHFLTKTFPKVAAEMALSVLAYNLTRAMNIVGIKPLIAAIVA
jgi:Transposase DDE domain